MDESYVSVIWNGLAIYPNKADYFRPHHAYPEYLFPDTVSQIENHVYDMVRESFKRLKLDNNNYGSEKWNPLGKFIKPGDNVLIKPNMVSDVNHNPLGSMECVYTHPSVTAVVIDYVLIAMQGKGELVVGDAPVQECRFDKLICESGYEDLIRWYSEQKVNIKLADLRSGSNQSHSENGVQYPQRDSTRDNGILVSLNERSAFCEVSEDVQQRMRVTNFDPRIMQQHHIGKKHEYMLAKELLKADVIINLPKPKTHRIAGITGAQKNMFGACANKEYLPHYTLGGKDENGDAYLLKNAWLSVAADVMDLRNIYNREGAYEKAKKAAEFYCLLHKEGHSVRNTELFDNGAWYGNETIWRTIADINQIMIYADKNGVMKDCPQRKMFIVGDMIVSGEKEGPLAPADYKARLIVAGEDALAFDRVVCAIMGFDEQLVPQLEAANMRPSHLPFLKNKKPIVVSNNPKWDKASLEEIKKASLRFIPSPSWEYVLGNPVKDTILNRISLVGKKMIIFGAGINGVSAYYYISKRYPEIQIRVFWDNDISKQDKTIVDKTKCKMPGEALANEVCLVCAQSRFLASMYAEAEMRGFTDRDILIFSTDFVGDGVEYKKAMLTNFR